MLKQRNSMSYPPPLGKLKWITAITILLHLAACKDKKYLEPQNFSSQLLSVLQEWYSKNPATWKNFSKSKSARINEADTSLFHPQWQQSSTLVDNEGNYVFNVSYKTKNLIIKFLFLTT
jgi:hypothetical protein